MAGVGTGTVARFNKVMKSGDEELKKKVLANEVSINAGYEKIKKSEKKKENDKCFHGNQYVEVSSPNGEQTKNKSLSPIGENLSKIHTDKKLKVLLAANFGRSKNSDSKQRKVAVEYVRLCGYKNGEIGKNHFQDSHNGKAEKMTLDEIAKQLGTSKTNLPRALSIERNLTESMKELLDTGVITKTLAADTITVVITFAFTINQCA